MVILNGLTTVFLLGDKIDKGIEGWIKISNRLKNIFSKTDRTYLDMEAAKLLGINHISNNIKIESLRVVMEAELLIKDLSGMLTDRKQKDFIAKPYCVYFITFEVNDNLLIALGVRSDGEIKEHYSFDKNDFIPF